MFVSLSASSWTTFRCESPDFTVRSAPDGVEFAVNRKSIESSQVFRDMFTLNDTGVQNDQAVDVYETPEMLIILLRLLHFPPRPPVLLPPVDGSEDDGMSSRRVARTYDSSTVIPLPILWLILELADKYVVSDAIIASLHSHLEVHVPGNPLQIYGYAWNRNLKKLAAKASQYLLPIASYGREDIGHISSVEAYHKVVQLQDLRLKELKKLVLSEDIFPHGYGICSVHHKETNALWVARRTQLACEVESVTDVAGEMNTLKDVLPKSCVPCFRAYTAAIKMLAYKSRKTLRRIDQLPAEN